jgi:hypothetical protein
MKVDEYTKLIVSKSLILNAMRNGYSSLREQRILAAYLARINPLNPETRTIRFTFSEFASLCKIKDVRGMKFSEYRQAAKNILHKTISLRTENGGYEDFVLFSHCLTEKESSGENYIELSASNEGMQFFFKLKQYFTYNLECLLCFKSTNQIRLYEILKENEWLRKFDIGLEELRTLMFIAPQRYKQFKDFNRDVLMVSQKIMNSTDKIDINFTYTTKRIGRKVGIISFTVIPKEPTVSSKIVTPPKNSDTQPYLKKKSSPITKKEIDDAKNSEIWYFAKQIADKRTKRNNNNINTTSERYATGIIKNWIERGYKTQNDLLKAGEISRKETNNKPSFDLDELDKQIYEDYKNHLGMEKNNEDNQTNR